MAAHQEKLAGNHVWKFFRAGGFDQVQLDSGEDLLALESLDQKLWVALSCPVDAVEFDRRTLELLDTDQDGHIRVPEILAALDFACRRLKEPELLLKGEDGFPLSAINPATKEGEQLLASARIVLERLGKSASGSITIGDACDTEAIFARTAFNGDGVVTPDSTESGELQEWILDIVTTLGGELDRGGEMGVNGVLVEKFSADATAWLAWQSETVSGRELSFPPESRESALELFAGLKAKIEDYFLRCRLAAYDSRAATVMNASDDHLQSLSLCNLSDSVAEIETLPLSAVNPAAVLNLEKGVNPAWGGRIACFRAEVVTPLLGERASLTAADWERIKECMADYEAWWHGRVETPVAPLGESRLSAWVEGGIAEKLTALIEQDLAVKDEFESIVDLERLARYCRDLNTLANNFVSFRDFYTGRAKAIFQAGTLYLDGRGCELCVVVKDIARHAVLATLSRVFLVYCDCVREGGSEKLTIAAAFTNGDSDQLVVGRNGVFYDRQGRDWDATIVRIIDHPISVRQAFWSPYKRIGKMVGEQVQKMAAARSKAAEEKAAAAAMNVGTAAKDGAKPAAQQAFDVGKFAGIFAAIGLAAGAIATAIAATVSGFLKLAWWQMPLAIAGVMLLISGPSVIIAWFKLRQRNLGPILDANGWAVNARAKLNIPFGASLTSIPRLPKGARQSIIDPYAEKKGAWRFYLLLAALLAALFVAWRTGYIKIPLHCSSQPPVAAPAK
jgi:hypothetical protein